MTGGVDVEFQVLLVLGWLGIAFGRLVGTLVFWISMLRSGSRLC